MLRASAAAKASTVIDEGPFTLYIATASPGSPTTADVAIHDALEAAGHTVGYHDHSNATLPGGCELLLFSPNNDYTATFNMWTIGVPVVDMAMNSIYVRGLLPWDNDTVTRFEGAGYFGQNVRYTAGIGWAGQTAPSIVDVLDSDQWTNGVPTRAAVDYSTDGDAQHFLSMGDDTDDSSSMGFFLPAGSTVTQPNDNPANEIQHTSTEHYVGLFLAATYAPALNADGEALLHAAVVKAMNG